MGSFSQVLLVVVPLLVVSAVCYFIVRSFMQFEEKKAKIKAQSAKLEIVLPVRMQAYERIILLLERITPENLIRRTLKVTLTARAYQGNLVATVRSEYEHNMAQQAYMSPTVWAMVKTATEETIRLINISGSKLPASAMASDLAENILKITSQITKFPTHVALDNLKRECAQYFLTTEAAKAKGVEDMHK